MLLVDILVVGSLACFAIAVMALAEYRDKQRRRR